MSEWARLLDLPRGSSLCHWLAARVIRAGREGMAGVVRETSGRSARRFHLARALDPRSLLRGRVSPRP